MKNDFLYADIQAHYEHFHHHDRTCVRKYANNFFLSGSECRSTMDKKLARCTKIKGTLSGISS